MPKTTPFPLLPLPAALLIAAAAAQSARGGLAPAAPGNAAQAAPFKRGGDVAEIGTPLYVLRQPVGSSAPAAFHLWELRPPERDKQLLAGSKLLLKFQGAQAIAFGFAGFRMTGDSIDPGVFFFLDKSGKIRRAVLEQDRNGSASVAPLAGEYTHLEEGAESTLFAIRKTRELVEIDPNGNIASAIPFERLQIPENENVVGLHRELDGLVRLVTDQGRFIGISGGRLAHIRPLPAGLVAGQIQQARLVEDVAWVQTKSPDMLIRHDFATSRTNKLNLSTLFQDRQGGQGFRFMGFNDAGSAYVRIGNHIYSLTPPMFGTGLSYRVVADSFFAQGVRPYGVDYDLFTEVLSMQPRQAERDGTVRRDVEVRGVALPETPKAKTFRLIREALASLDLKNGMNEIPTSKYDFKFNIKEKYKPIEPNYRFNNNSLPFDEKKFYESAKGLHEKTIADLPPPQPRKAPQSIYRIPPCAEFLEPPKRQ